MKIMKKNILLASAGAATLATSISLGASLFASHHEAIIRATTSSWTIGLLSVALFFVGLAYPKEQ